MKLSMSNIAWGPEQDRAAYALLQKYGFTGLEIAPTRIFPEQPYARLEEAAAWAQSIRAEYGLEVPSIQSIWYGRKEKLFGPPQERQALLEYTGAALRFAQGRGLGACAGALPRPGGHSTDQEHIHRPGA